MDNLSEYWREYQTDNESYGDSDSNSYYDDIEEEEEDEYEYDPGEQSCTKNNIVISQQYSDMDIEGYELVHIRLKKFDYHQIQTMYRVLMHQRPACKLDIAECVYLPSGHCVAISKTFWIRIIQRAWKKVYKQRKQYFSTMMQKIMSREIFINYPRKLPGLRGLLCSL
jgi:hypothetical protein